MRFLGNLIWMLFGGLLSSIIYFLAGLVLCLTLIFIPFGIQCFKLSVLTFCPFGKHVECNFTRHPVMNVIWLVLGGAGSTAGYAIAGFVFCLTIVGIPFGIQFFKLMRLCAFPFGAKVH